MGFSYSQFGLCCDFCGESKPEFNVKKISCPYGYCQAWACCKNCKAKKLHLLSSCTPDKKTHKEYCKSLSLEYNVKEKEKQTLLESGKFLRISAIGYNDKAKVIFKNKEGIEKGFFISLKTYHKLGYGTNTTIEDYRALEEIEECQNTDLNDGEKYLEALN